MVNSAFCWVNGCESRGSTPACPASVVARMGGREAPLPRMEFSTAAGLCWAKHKTKFTVGEPRMVSAAPCLIAGQPMAGAGRCRCLLSEYLEIVKRRFIADWIC